MLNGSACPGGPDPDQSRYILIIVNDCLLSTMLGGSACAGGQDPDLPGEGDEEQHGPHEAARHQRSRCSSWGQLYRAGQLR